MRWQWRSMQSARLKMKQRGETLLWQVKPGCLSTRAQCRPCPYLLPSHLPPSFVLPVPGPPPLCTISLLGVVSVLPTRKPAMLLILGLAQEMRRQVAPTSITEIRAPTKSNRIGLHSFLPSIGEMLKALMPWTRQGPSSLPAIRYDSQEILATVSSYGCSVSASTKSSGFFSSSSSSSCSNAL